MKEEVVLNKNTVSVASYTVAVKGFNDGLEFTEQEIKSHFAEVGSHCSDLTNFACLIWYNNYYDVLFDRSRARR
jgi:RNA recognition motif-containing protein